MEDKTLPAGGRLAAWAGFLFGSVMSIAANVLHAWIPPADGHLIPPSFATQVGAAVWPIGLLISVEVLSRVRWPDGALWALARYGGAGTVAVGSAVISYGHLHGVLVAWGYGTLGAAVGPLVLDGLMVVSGFALLAEPGAPNRQPAPILEDRVRAPLQVVDQRYHPEPADGPDQTDRLLPQLVQWSEGLTEPPSARAVRTRFGIGHDRAKRLLEQLAVAQ